MRKTPDFDEKNIIFSFGAISDIHITGGEDDSEEKFRRALKQLKAGASHGLDAMLVVGDLINSREEKQLVKFKDIYEDEMKPFVPIVYCLGNWHDLFWGDENQFAAEKFFFDCLGEKHFSFDTDIDAAMRGNRHAVICGQHIIALTPISISPIRYGDDAKKWLSDILEKISAEEPEKHIFVITHPMIHDTCYGSLLGDEWDTADLTPILSEYPQVVTFGGHLHYPLNDERSIMQKSFTALGCGSVRYMAIEHGPDGNGYMYERGHVVQYGYRFSQGLLCEVDASQNIRVTRMDFYTDKKIKTPWIIGNTLDTYREDRKDSAKAPYFEKTADISLEKGKDERGCDTYFLCFDAANDDDMVHHYKITATADGERFINKTMISDFFRHADTAEMTKNCRIDLCDLPKGDVKISVIAVNSWDKESDPLEKVFLL